MAKPKLALIPAAQGDKFYSVLPSSGVGDFDFTRSGGATRINSQGLIETVADGVSRLNYPLIDGKVVGCPSHLLEPQSLNSQTNSEDLSDTSSFSYGAVSVSVNQIISPNGTLNADKLIESNSTARHELYGKLLNFSGNTTVSFFAKADERQYISVFIAGATVTGGATFDVKNGLISGTSGGTDANIINYGNGWYRCSFTSTNSENAPVYYCLRTNGNEVAVQTYQGDGTSGMYLWGFQTEIGQSYPTSYIPTTTSAATRSAETATNSGDASTFNDSEGVLMAEISALADDGTARVITINDGGSSDYIGLRYHTVSNTIRFLIKSGGTTNFDYYITLPSTEEYNKIAIKYDNTNVYLWANGFEYFQFSPIITPIGLSTLDFDDSVGGDDFYGNTKQIQYFDSALTESELEKLTSWVSFSDMAEGQLYSVE